jgi:hypothetical protein
MSVTRRLPWRGYVLDPIGELVTLDYMTRVVLFRAELALRAGNCPQEVLLALVEAVGVVGRRWDLPGVGILKRFHFVTYGGTRVTRLGDFHQLGYFCRIIDRIAQEWQYIGLEIHNIFAYIICLKTWLVLWHHLAWQLFGLLFTKLGDFCSISSGHPGRG